MQLTEIWSTSRWGTSLLAKCYVLVRFGASKNCTGRLLGPRWSIHLFPKVAESRKLWLKNVSFLWEKIKGEYLRGQKDTTGLLLDIAWSELGGEVALHQGNTFNKRWIILENKRRTAQRRAARLQIHKPIALNHFAHTCLLTWFQVMPTWQFLFPWPPASAVQTGKRTVSRNLQRRLRTFWTGEIDYRSW